jgi:hypothetical protein
VTATGHDVEAARAIERAVLDYFEGWFDVTRMPGHERSE